MVQASDRLVLSFLGGFQVRAESGAKIRVRTLGNACPLVFASAALAIGIPGLLTPTPSPTVFDLPSGVPPANDYLNGIHLIDNGSFISPLEDRSTAWVEFQTVPALSRLLLLDVGLVGTTADHPVPDLPSEPALLSGWVGHHHHQRPPQRRSA